MKDASTAIARTAAGVFIARQQRAGEMVRNRAMNAMTAERHLLPWLAIACRCGADLPELADALADLQARSVSGEWILSIGMARALLADEICPRARWAPALTAARDAALRGPLESAAQITNARALDALASHLAVDINGLHPIPPFNPTAADPSAAAQERKAA